MFDAIIIAQTQSYFKLVCHPHKTSNYTIMLIYGFRVGSYLTGSYAIYCPRSSSSLDIPPVINKLKLIVHTVNV